jgi:hypothetical protein
MPANEGTNQRRETENKLRVGWQRLTKQQFVEALTVALLDKVRTRRPEQANVSTGVAAVRLESSRFASALPAPPNSGSHVGFLSAQRERLKNFVFGFASRKQAD